MAYILAYDIGTTGVKTCLFEVDKSIRLIADASRSYPLYILDNGGAEQDGDDWWRGMAESTREIFSRRWRTICPKIFIHFLYNFPS